MGLGKLVIGGVGVVAALWSGGWVYLREQAGPMLDRQLAAMRSGGTDIAYSGLQIGGFPFGYDGRMEAPRFEARVTALNPRSLRPEPAIVTAQAPFLTMRASVLEGRRVRTDLPPEAQVEARFGDSEWRLNLLTDHAEALGEMSGGRMRARHQAALVVGELREQGAPAESGRLRIENLSLTVDSPADGPRNAVRGPRGEISADLFEFAAEGLGPRASVQAEAKVDGLTGAFDMGGACVDLRPVGTAAVSLGFGEGGARSVCGPEIPNAPAAGAFSARAASLAFTRPDGVWRAQFGDAEADVTAEADGVEASLKAAGLSLERPNGPEPLLTAASLSLAVSAPPRPQGGGEAAARFQASSAAIDLEALPSPRPLTGALDVESLEGAVRAMLVPSTGGGATPQAVRIDHLRLATLGAQVSMEGYAQASPDGRVIGEGVLRLVGASDAVNQARARGMISWFEASSLNLTLGVVAPKDPQTGEQVIRIVSDGETVTFNGGFPMPAPRLRAPGG